MDAPARALIGLPGGGFQIRTQGEPSIVANLGETGWRVDEPEAWRGWTLSRVGSGFVLARPGGDEAGSVSREPGSSAGDGPAWLLLDDGRLFRVGFRGPRRCRFELRGWETSGAYFEAIPEKAGWTIAPTVAGAGLRGVTPLLMLFVAEILDAESSEGTNRAEDGDA